MPTATNPDDRSQQLSALSLIRALACLAAAAVRRDCNLTSGTFSNQGSIEALNGSFVTYTTSAVTANNVAGVLTGGTWRAVSTGSGATITLRGSSITQIAAGTEVELSGSGSVLQVAAVPIDSTLTTNQGSFSILNGRNFSAASTFSNTGTVTIGTGSTFTAPAVSQLTGGQLTAGGWHLGQNATLSVAGPNITTNFGDVSLDLFSSFPQINTLVDNRGSFAFVNGQSFTPVGPFINSGTMTIGTNSAFNGTLGFTQTATGTLRGTGTFFGNLVNPGAIRPGNSPGTITIDGDLDLLPTSVLEIEVGGLTPGTQHDEVIVTGNATLGRPTGCADHRWFRPRAGRRDQIPLRRDRRGRVCLGLLAESGQRRIPTWPSRSCQARPTCRSTSSSRSPISNSMPTPTRPLWSDASTWNIGVEPDTRNIIAVQNLAGVPQRVDVVHQGAFVHQLEVEGDTGSITIGVKSGNSLSAIVGTTIGDQATIELDDGNLVSSMVSIEGGGLLAGNGTVVGNLAVGTSGVEDATLRPGFSVGHLDVEGDYQQGASGTMLIDIEGDGAGQFDTIDVTGEVTLGGTLVVDATAFASVTPGTSVTIMTAGEELAPGSEFDRVLTVGMRPGPVLRPDLSARRRGDDRFRGRRHGPAQRRRRKRHRILCPGPARPDLVRRRIQPRHRAPIGLLQRRRPVRFQRHPRLCTDSGAAQYLQRHGRDRACAGKRAGAEYRGPRGCRDSGRLCDMPK